MNTVCIVYFGGNQTLPSQESPRRLTGRRDSPLHFAKRRLQPRRAVWRNDLGIFKVPENEPYQFLHRRFRARERWEGHLSDTSKTFASGRASQATDLGRRQNRFSGLKGGANARTELLQEF